jgi:hypothetical protein
MPQSGWLQSLSDRTPGEGAEDRAGLAHSGLVTSDEEEVFGADGIEPGFESLELSGEDLDERCEAGRCNLTQRHSEDRDPSLRKSASEAGDSRGGPGADAAGLPGSGHVDQQDVVGGAIPCGSPVVECEPDGGVCSDLPGGLKLEEESVCGPSDPSLDTSSAALAGGVEDAPGSRINDTNRRGVNTQESREMGE